MKIVPVIKSSDLQRSLLFYTEVLDFERRWPGHEDTTGQAESNELLRPPRYSGGEEQGQRDQPFDSHSANAPFIGSRHRAIIGEGQGAAKLPQ